MEELGFAGLLIEPGASLDYFAGVSWGRSERLFGLLLPQRGEGVVIAPAFEKQRASWKSRDGSRSSPGRRMRARMPWR